MILFPTKPNKVIKSVKTSGSTVFKSVFLGDLESNKFDELKLELDSIIEPKVIRFMFTMSKAD